VRRIGLPREARPHDTRGEYTEIERVIVGDAAFKVETATSADGRSMQMLFTTLAVPPALRTDDSLVLSEPLSALVTLHVLEPFKPRTCNTTLANASTTLVAHCPGLPVERGGSGFSDGNVARGRGQRAIAD
jgi:hypothetical protein